MDMEIARLSSISWAQIPDRQAVAVRGVWQQLNQSWTQLARRGANDPRPVPMLDWPAALFQDEILGH
jgi:hypothetical protein